MSSYIRMLHKLAERSNGQMRITKVALDKRPTAESLRSLEREISAQVSINDAMRQRSYMNAGLRS